MSGFITVFIPIPIIKNLLLFNVITSWSIPQTFFLFKSISFGNFRFTLLFLQKYLIALDIKIALISVNSLNGGYLFF